MNNVQYVLTNVHENDTKIFPNSLLRCTSTLHSKEMNTHLVLFWCSL